MSRFTVLQTYTGINVGYQTGCGKGSVPLGLCILVVDAGVAVAEMAQESATPGVGDFSISGDQSITIPRGIEAGGFVNIVSQGGFFCGGRMATTVSPVRKKCPVISLNNFLIFFLPCTSSTAGRFF